jgi:hypothetical protein
LFLMQFLRCKHFLKVLWHHFLIFFVFNLNIFWFLINLLHSFPHLWFERHDFGVEHTRCIAWLYGVFDPLIFTWITFHSLITFT